ncbi:MAG TPA: polyketide synthase dehydratase domain-containing protein, partial [Euzebya sp.]|nr:polyketide synthase dehydratase domain-containing protein [Euzebya sp.]
AAVAAAAGSPRHGGVWDDPVADTTSAEHHARAEAAGLSLGPAFRAARSVARAADGAGIAHVELPPEVDMAEPGHHLHPVLLDACLQAASVHLPERAGMVHLPTRVEALDWWAAPPPSLVCRATLRSDDAAGDRGVAGDVIVDAQIRTRDGDPVASVQGLHLRAVPHAMLRPEAAPLADDVYGVAWRSLPARRTDVPSSDPRPSDPRPSDPDTPNSRTPDPHPSGSGSSDHRTPAQVALQLRPLVATLVSDAEIAGYSDRLAVLETRATAHVHRALRDLGWSARPGTQVTAADAAAHMGVQDPFVPLLHRMLAMLAEDGVLDAGAAGDGGRTFTVRTDLPSPEVAAGEVGVGDPLLPTTHAELAVLDACGAALPAVLTGAQDPLALLFPNGDTETVAGLYGNAIVARLSNRLVRELIATAGAGRADGLRIVELGAGTGETTAAVLPALRPEDRYTVSDVSPFFLARTRERVGADERVDYRVLDLEQPPGPQGMPPAAADVVIAANVLHVTADAGQGVAHACALLRPGGLLVVQEGAVALRWVDLTFGLTHGWWRFTDHAVRPDHPLLPPRGWKAVLEAAGCADAEVLTPTDGDVRGHQAVIIASCGDEQAVQTQRILLVTDDDAAGSGLQARLRARGCVDVEVTAARHLRVALAAGTATAVVSLSGPARASEEGTASLGD